MAGQIDYSLYLVTDSTESILGSRDLVDVVEQALLGGGLCAFLLSVNIHSIIPQKCFSIDITSYFNVRARHMVYIGCY